MTRLRPGIIRVLGLRLGLSCKCGRVLPVCQTCGDYETMAKLDPEVRLCALAHYVTRLRAWSRLPPSSINLPSDMLLTMIPYKTV